MATVQLNKKVPALQSRLPPVNRLSGLRMPKAKTWWSISTPRTHTPGCTREGQDFRDNYTKFKRNKTLVVGVSRDSIKSHEKFKAKQGFPFDLLSDPDETLCTLFDVIKEKNMYGRKVMGIERSTFLIGSRTENCAVSGARSRSTAMLKKSWKRCANSIVAAA